MADAVAKRRHAHGEGCRQSKLTVEVIREMQTLYALGEVTQADLAKRFGVNQSNVSRAIREERWRVALGKG